MEVTPHISMSLTPSGFRGAFRCSRTNADTDRLRPTHQTNVSKSFWQANCTRVLPARIIQRFAVAQDLKPRVASVTRERKLCRGLGRCFFVGGGLARAFIRPKGGLTGEMPKASFGRRPPTPEGVRRSSGKVNLMLTHAQRASFSDKISKLSDIH